MQLYINGKERELKTSQTIAEMVRELAINVPHFAIALNYDVISKAEYESTHIKEGDRVEIVHAVGGGI